MSNARGPVETDTDSADDSVTTRFVWAGQLYTLQLSPCTARALERHLEVPNTAAA